MGGFVIQHNLSAMNSQRTYGLVADRNFKSAEKLSSGYKVNRAADDAAGLAISEKMRRQIRGLRQAEDNIQDGISFVQVADGALNETHDILQRMNELCVKGANDTLNDSDRSYINDEIQALKKETDRIFDTTSFNDRFIWNVEIEDPILVGYDPTQALYITNSKYGNYTVSPSLRDYMPVVGSLKVAADDNGATVSWKTFGGNTYTTDNITWEELEASNYDFNIYDHLPSSIDNATKAILNEYINNTIYMNVETTTATKADYIKALNGASSEIYYSDKANATFVSPSDTKGVTASATINIYAKDYSSKATSNAYSFESNTNDEFVGPKYKTTTTGTDTSTNTGTTNLIQSPGNPATVEAAQSATTPWTFTFTMSGVGDITATSYSAVSSSNDDRAENEGVWWRYLNKKTNSRELVTHSADGNLAGVMSLLTGSTGVLSENHEGDTNASGNIAINFNLTANNSFSSAGSTTTDVGTLTINIPVTTDDTEETILEKVNAALTNDTVIDLSQSSKDYFYWRAPSHQSSVVNVPVYGGQIGMIIQSGSERDNDIPIYYEKLNNGVLGIRDLEITTSASAAAAIETVQKAFHIVTEQRSVFGAYQNRMEHAVLNDNNIRINTQDSESQIRDTDMAKEMVNYSLTNILKQSGQSMLAQANQSKQGVMSLLQ